MGKRLVIAGFLLCMGLAVYIYLTRDVKSLRENINKASVKEPRVTLEDFVIYRYAANTVKARLAARIGQFFEPNLIELDGEIRGERVNDKGEREAFGAESATAYFNATSLTKMLDQEHPAELDRAEMTGFVEVSLKDNLLTTDYAEFLSREKLVRSLRPVRVEGPGRVFVGDEGFTYGLVTQVLEMQGAIKGEVTLEQK